jgi:hypothetical protein
VGGVAVLAAVLVSLWWYFFRGRNASKPLHLSGLPEERLWEMEARDKTMAPAEMEVPNDISINPVEYHEVQA